MGFDSQLRIGKTDLNIRKSQLVNIVSPEIEKRAARALITPDVQKEIALAYLNRVTQFVPMEVNTERAGTLRLSGRVTNDGRLVWSAVNKGFDYASRVHDMYTRGGHYKKPSTPGTYPWWEYFVSPENDNGEWTVFTDEVKRIVSRRMRDEQK